MEYVCYNINSRSPEEGSSGERRISMATTKAAAPIVANFGYTNTTESTNSVKLIQLGLVTNYGKTTDISTKCTLSNVTAPTDQPELIEFTSSRVPTVKSPITNYYPPRVLDGVTYGVNVYEIASSVSDDGKQRTDFPCGVEIKFHQSVNGQVTSDMMLEILTRAVSALFKADGSSRIPDLVRSSLAPVEN